MLNTQAEAVNQVEVRRAIALMMDRSLLNERVLYEILKCLLQIAPLI